MNVSQSSNNFDGYCQAEGEKGMKKRYFLMLLLACIVCFSFCAKTNVEAAGSTTSVDLYVLNSGYEAISIPSNYPQQYQISLGSSATYSVISGDSVTVSNAGLVKPFSTTYYWRNGVGSTTNDGGQYDSITTEYNYGTSVVRATSGGNTYEYSVTVKSYASVYASQVMDQYLEDHIRSGMTDMEILEVIAQFPCQYDYSVYYSSAAGMIISGGGDCWASSDAIIQLAEKLGLQARSRDGRGDPGAGSGHMNALVKIGGKNYVIEAGMEGTAPRSYLIWEEKEFTYEVNDDNQTAVLTKYTGMDTSLEIPREIDGYTITEIGRICFYQRHELKSVTIPDTVKKIDEYAFYQTGIQSVVIPDSVTEIGKDAFVTLIDYNGPNGSYGALLPLEEIDLPAQVSKLGVNLSETAVLYHGTKAQWDGISHTDGYKAPQNNKLFCSTKGLEVSTGQVVKLKKGKTTNVDIYSLNDEITMVNGNESLLSAKIVTNKREYYRLRNANRDQAYSDVKTLQLQGLEVGQTQVKLSNNNTSITLDVIVEEASAEDNTGDTQTTESQSTKKTRKNTTIRRYQPMSVTVAKKNVKAKKLKKKAVTIRPITVKSAQGYVHYMITGGKKKSRKRLKINADTGKITVKKEPRKVHIQSRLL